MAKDGSTPQACTATVSIDVVEVLPCVPATATLRRPAMTAASATARGSTRRPALAGGRRARGCRRGWRWRRRRCRRRRGAPGRARPRPARPARAAPAGSGCRAGRCPETGTPRASRIRAMPLIPAPPMPDEVHRAQLRQRRHRVRPGGHVRGAHRSVPPPSSTMSASRSSASGTPAAAACRGVPGQRGRVGEQRHQVLGSIQAGVEVGVLHQQAAAGLDDRQRVAPLLAVADRQRDERRRQPDGGQLGDGHRARPGTGRGRRRRRRGPCVPDSPRPRRAPTRRARRRPSRRCSSGPRACSTCTPAAVSASAAPTAARFSEAAPCEPPNDEQGGPVGVQAELGAGLGPPGGPVQRADRRPQRHADVLAAVQRRARATVTATRAASRAPTRLASPGSAFCSCTTIGTLARRAAR